MDIRSFACTYCTMNQLNCPVFVGFLAVEANTKYRSREFWCKGYYVDTVGKNTSRIAEYIKNQLKEDQMGEQLTMSEVGPFKGSK